MSNAAILSPVFVQVALTLALLVALGRARWRASREQGIHIRDIALGQDRWPEQPTKIARAYTNQFEAPTLFYAVVAMALAARLTDVVFVALEWGYVLLRVAHAYVHVTSNHVPTRFRIFLTSVGVLIALWVWLALKAVGLI